VEANLWSVVSFFFILLAGEFFFTRLAGGMVFPQTNMIQLGGSESEQM
jgi:hypothetical protein